MFSQVLSPFPLWTINCYNLWLHSAPNTIVFCSSKTISTMTMYELSLIHTQEINYYNKWMKFGQKLIRTWNVQLAFYAREYSIFLSTIFGNPSLQSTRELWAKGDADGNIFANGNIACKLWFLSFTRLGLALVVNQYSPKVLPLTTGHLVCKVWSRRKKTKLMKKERKHTRDPQNQQNGVSARVAVVRCIVIEISIVCTEEVPTSFLQFNTENTLSTSEDGCLS